MLAHSLKAGESQFVFTNKVVEVEAVTVEKGCKVEVRLNPCLPTECFWAEDVVLHEITLEANISKGE